jgi:serine/threonine protein kinase
MRCPEFPRVQLRPELEMHQTAGDERALPQTVRRPASFAEQMSHSHRSIEVDHRPSRSGCNRRGALPSEPRGDDRAEHPGAERVKLLDFGLARLVVPSVDASVSRFGAMLGTAAYMAPEQITAETSDARTDVYAVGLLLFEMVVGCRAFCGADSEVLSQQLADPLPLLWAGTVHRGTLRHRARMRVAH